MRSSVGAILALLAGCATTPTPDPAGPTVLKEAQVVEVPVAVTRRLPADLLAPIVVEAPAIAQGTGDYCLSRSGLEVVIDAFRATGEKLARWRAWAR